MCNSRPSLNPRVRGSSPGGAPANGDLESLVIPGHFYVWFVPVSQPRSLRVEGVVGFILCLWRSFVSVRCGTRPESYATHLLFAFCRMLEARLSRRVSVVRSSGRSGWVGTTRHHQRVPGAPDGQAVISASRVRLAEMSSPDAARPRSGACWPGGRERPGAFQPTPSTSRSWSRTRRDLSPVPGSGES
jgi:hypothetical protein